MSGDSPADMAEREIEAVVLGASAGAVAALSAILPGLPADYPLPILIVVHLPRDRSSGLAALFQSKCQLTVKEAEDKEPIVPGTVYFAPPDYHLLVESNRTLSLSCEEPVNFSRPAIDVLFESAADTYGEALLAIVLTGANHDGSKGLKAVCELGGRAVVQTPESAEIRVMPESALAACEKASPMALAQILELLHRAGS